MRSIYTAVVLAISSPVFLSGQSALGAGGKLITPAGSDETTSPQEPAAEPAVEDLRPSGVPIALVSSQGTLLHLTSAARTVFVANEDVADVQVQQQQREFIYVTAKKPGITVLYAADDAGRVLLNKFIEVTGGPVSIIKAGALSIGGEPTPAPGTVVTQSTMTTPTGTVEKSTTSSRSTITGSP
jgi:Flp pilus assembly secretin CpaC